MQQQFCELLRAGVVEQREVLSEHPWTALGLRVEHLSWLCCVPRALNRERVAT